MYRLDEYKQKKSSLVTRISTVSTRFDDKLVKFLDRYELIGLNDATIEQLEEFIQDENIR